MTFGMLIFASDGWLMSIDERELNFPFRAGATANKILCDESAQTAGCYAGDIASRIIVEDLISAINEGTLRRTYSSESDRQRQIETIADASILKAKTVFREHLGGDIIRQVLVVMPPYGDSGDARFGEAWEINGVDKTYAHRKAHYRGARFILPCCKRAEMQH